MQEQVLQAPEETPVSAASLTGPASRKTPRIFGEDEATPDPIVANSGHGGQSGVPEHGSGRSNARKPSQSHWRCCTSVALRLSSPPCGIRDAGATWSLSTLTMI
jgi:hypothetical protein